MGGWDDGRMGGWVDGWMGGWQDGRMGRVHGAGEMGGEEWEVHAGVVAGRLRS